MIMFFFAFVIISGIITFLSESLGSEKMWSKRRKHNYYKSHKNIWENH